MKRASVIFFDEAAFCSDEILSIAAAFGAQDMDFKTSTEEGYDPRKRPKQVPVQVIYASSQDGMDTIFYKNYKELFIKKGSIIKDLNNNYYLIIKTKKNSIDLFKVQIDNFYLNKHYSYRYNNYNIEFNNIININNLDNFDIIGIIPDNIVDIVVEKNKSYDENKNKTNDINIPKKQRARIHDFIVYKNNFYVVEDKYENILICRCQNSKNKKHINYYADYKIVGADLTRKRS